MNEASAGPAYRIETPRMVIRCWKPGDAQLLKTAIDSSLDHLRPWMPFAANEPTDVQTKINLLRRFRGNFDLDVDYVYGIFDRDEAEVLGGTGLHTRIGKNALEIGYWIRADAVGRGLATEATAALTQIAFVVNGVDRVEIHCDPQNSASAAVPRKLGFTHEATLQRRIASGDDGEMRDSMIWTLFRDAYKQTPVADVTVLAYDVFGRKLS
ncbi:MAG: GNAT family N-acetyltransferase [Anaerolineae bacterium]|nr:GNAT family N-acetyltransferase [Anaerolineae bacterium]